MTGKASIHLLRKVVVTTAHKVLRNRCRLSSLLPTSFPSNHQFDFTQTATSNQHRTVRNSLPSSNLGPALFLPERPTARTDVYVYICICIPEPVGYLRCIPEILVYINFALASRLGRIVSNIIGTHLTLPLHPPSFSLFAKYPPLQRQESNWADPQNPMLRRKVHSTRRRRAFTPRSQSSRFQRITQPQLPLLETAKGVLG